MIGRGLLIFTRISSRAIVGVGTSLNTNCPPYSNNLTAFMRALLESAQWAPRARASQNSEHAVGVGGRDVRGEPWDGVVRAAAAVPKRRLCPNGRWRHSHRFSCQPPMPFLTNKLFVGIIEHRLASFPHLR